MESTVVVGIIVLGLLVLLTIAAERGRRIRVRAEEAERQHRLSEQVHEERKHQLQEQHASTRGEARERARIAYPEMLDESEVDIVPAATFPSDADAELIERALELVTEEMAAIEAAEPGIFRYSDAVPQATLSTWQGLSTESGTLRLVDQDGPDFEKSSLFLDAPARIVDCGEAGQINLFTQAQVHNAQKQSGAADYIGFLERRASAPLVAQRVTERASKKREAEEAHIASITTRLEDLPPLPRDKS